MSENFWPTALFYLVLPGLAVPFLIAGIFFRVWPTGRLVALLPIPIIFSFLFFLTDQETGLASVAEVDLFLFLLFLADFWTTGSARRLQVERKTERIASLAVKHPVELTLKNNSRRDLIISGADDRPVNLIPEPGYCFGRRRLPAGMSETIAYRTLPTVRGSAVMEHVWLELSSRLGFWKKEVRTDVFSEIRVYPNLRQLRQYELLARKERLHLLGLRRVRRIGLENDFERLRDYTPDDQYRFIDWAATARKNRLIVREFQQTRNQRILFMIDAGRMMTGCVERLSLLDHAFNATLMLAYIALKNGDEAGLLVFSDRIRQYIPPAGGMRQINRLIAGCYDLFPEQVESRYDLAFAHVSAQCRKRSLLVFVSNISDSDNSERIGDYLLRNIGRHLPLGVFLRDHPLFDRANEAANILDRARFAAQTANPAMVGATVGEMVGAAGGDFGALRFTPTEERLLYSGSASAEIISRRRHALAELTAKGPLLLDVFPEEMTAPLINKYLEIKARQLL